MNKLNIELTDKMRASLIDALDEIKDVQKRAILKEIVGANKSVCCQFSAVKGKDVVLKGPAQHVVHQINN